MHTRKSGWIAAAAFTALAGCASNQVPPPRVDLAKAEQAVNQAVVADAPRYAPLYLNEAREKLDLAREAMRGERYVQARRWAQEAQASAELALSLSQAERTAQLASQSLQNVEVLRQELLQREQQQSLQQVPPGEG